MKADIAIIGAGIAGASLAAELAPDATVILVEAEGQPGYHSTGRSAAFWSETYGGPAIRPLTLASRAFLADPPALFSDRAFLSPRGAIHLASDASRAKLDKFAAAFAADPVTFEPLDRDQLVERIPGLRRAWSHALLEPGCSDIDVGGLHGAYLGQLRRYGGALATSFRVESISREASGWRLGARGETIEAAIIVNAAGAWADDIARLAGARHIGIAPHRRTIVQLNPDPPAPSGLPLVIDAAGGFYFKGEAGGRIWLSPSDETPCAACDSAPEEIDIALAVDRLAAVVDWRVERVDRAWSGLRSFAPDRLPVYGFDRRAPGFFWFAGQGGFGIQTAPAAARLGASLVLSKTPHESLRAVNPASYAPTRFG